MTACVGSGLQQVQVGGTGTQAQQWVVPGLWMVLGMVGDAQEQKNLTFAPYVCSSQAELDGSLALCIPGQTSLLCPYQRGEVQGTSLCQSLSLKQSSAQLSVLDRKQVGGLHLAA